MIADLDSDGLVFAEDFDLGGSTTKPPMSKWKKY